MTGRREEEGIEVELSVTMRGEHTRPDRRGELTARPKKSYVMLRPVPTLRASFVPSVGSCFVLTTPLTSLAPRSGRNGVRYERRDDPRSGASGRGEETSRERDGKTLNGSALILFKSLSYLSSYFSLALISLVFFIILP